MNIDGISNSELSRCIDEWIRNERNRKILKRRMIDGICYEPLAEEFGMSVRQVKLIVCQGQQTIINRTKIAHLFHSGEVEPGVK